MQRAIQLYQLEIQREKEKKHQEKIERRKLYYVSSKKSRQFKMHISLWL